MKTRRVSTCATLKSACPSPVPETTSCPTSAARIVITPSKGAVRVPKLFRSSSRRTFACALLKAACEAVTLLCWTSEEAWYWSTSCCETTPDLPSEEYRCVVLFAKASWVLACAIPARDCASAARACRSSSSMSGTSSSARMSPLFDLRSNIDLPLFGHTRWRGHTRSSLGAAGSTPGGRSPRPPGSARPSRSGPSASRPRPSVPRRPSLRGEERAARSRSRGEPRRVLRQPPPKRAAPASKADAARARRPLPLRDLLPPFPQRPLPLPAPQSCFRSFQFRRGARFRRFGRGRALAPTAL